MKRKARRLAIVKQVFANRELDSARQLGEFQAQLDQAAIQLKQLSTHRDRAAAELRAGLTTDPGRLQNQQAFQSTLNQAISQQQQLIARAKAERNEMRRRWLARRAKTQSIEKLCDKRQVQEQQAQTVHEQKQQDEVTQTMSLYNAESNGS